jgi:hypothetical protein
MDIIVTLLMKDIQCNYSQLNGAQQKLCILYSIATLGIKDMQHNEILSISISI